MTRVTNELRAQLRNKIMGGLPVIDYISQIHALVQKVVIDHADPDVKEMYDNPDLRDYLAETEIEVRMGNHYLPMHRGDNTRCVKGLSRNRSRSLSIQMNDNPLRLPENSIYRSLIVALKESGLVAKYIAQDELHDSVRRRLKANLDASKTFKQLYEILEPELHHYIPKDEAAAQLPACVAPVVDDLRKLGAVLPDTPKAAG